jgi:uncharacterized protein YjbI with pentapeptide repeats
MKKSFALLLATTVLASPAFGYKQEDLDYLKAKNECQSCDLSGAFLDLARLFQANLTGADLTKAILKKTNLLEANLTNAVMLGADLTGAILLNAELDYADFTNAKLCNTVMPDGQRIFKDC